ncbi:caspase family protein [Amycolatopsis samaneae]|uniref:Caspase domain-containing protein n=1 Tax=Amycolatopsis samaneae TaxID=664691 RepID=A0ABW5GS84_9PSEU
MTARLPDPERSRAVLIGTSSYTDPTLPPLPAVNGNVSDLYGLLTAEHGTGLPGAHCAVLRDPPDAGTVGESLAHAADQAEDVLLVYYAGHGLLWTNRNELHLALCHTRSQTVGTSALRFADVRQAFLDSHARTRVLIVDCCFSGYATERVMGDAAGTLLSQVDVDGAYILAATEPNQLAHAPEGRRTTLFTGELLRLLAEGIPDGPELLTLDELYRQVKAALGRRNLPVPTCANRDGAGQLALARNTAVLSPRQRGEGDGLREGYPSQREKLRTAVDELAAQEAETVRVRQAVLEKIADARLPHWAGSAPAFRDRLDNLDELKQEARWTRLGAELDLSERAIPQALRNARDALEVAKGLLDQRAELRGRLAVYLAMAVRLGVAEDDELAARYGVAHDLLWTKPCDLRAATLATRAYQRSVTDRREAR